MLLGSILKSRPGGRAESPSKSALARTLDPTNFFSSKLICTGPLFAEHQTGPPERKAPIPRDPTSRAKLSQAEPRFLQLRLGRQGLERAPKVGCRSLETLKPSTALRSGELRMSQSMFQSCSEATALRTLVARTLRDGGIAT